MIHLGAVSFLNTKPLIYGLDKHLDIQIHLDVPSSLLPKLQQGAYDVALLPIIDFQRMPGLRLLQSSAIGSDGPTLTVGIFSKIPIPQIKTLACDPDSHTSVALARIILAEKFQIKPNFVPIDQPADAVLLIGDKVVSSAPPTYPYRIDLGEQWKSLTGLPFVFAAWMTPNPIKIKDLPQRLLQARIQGLAHAQEIAQEFAPKIGWPVETALAYLTHTLCFEINPPQIEAITLFHKKAYEHGLIPDIRPLQWV